MGKFPFFLTPSPRVTCAGPQTIRDLQICLLIKWWSRGWEKASLKEGRQTREGVTSRGHFVPIHKPEDSALQYTVGTDLTCGQLNHAHSNYHKFQGIFLQTVRTICLSLTLAQLFVFRLFVFCFKAQMLNFVIFSYLISSCWLDSISKSGEIIVNFAFVIHYCNYSTQLYVI